VQAAGRGQADPRRRPGDQGDPRLEALHEDNLSDE
jgi:hypothetical protein